MIVHSNDLPEKGSQVGGKREERKSPMQGRRGGLVLIGRAFVSGNWEKVL